MTPNSRIFCNSPWFELHIYWDGGLGICCQEFSRLYPMEEKSRFNICNMSIKDWYDSQPVKDFRMAMWGDSEIPACFRCTQEQKLSDTSRRHKANQKSVIFTRTNFDESFQQSPHVQRFVHSKLNQGQHLGLPVEMHVDLGNFCNLACKMCTPKASSRIAAQMVKWGHQDSKQFVGSDWTRDTAAWKRFLDDVVALPMKNIHFMGGETLLTPRFHEFVDHMLGAGKTDMGISFVTNGTVWDLELIEKLKQFRRTGIEVSIESLDATNAYQRQGTDQQLVMSNIDRYIEHCDNSSISLSVRPAISALTIGSYHTLLEFCLERQLIVKSLVVEAPRFLHPSVLPWDIRQSYRKYYTDIIDKYSLSDSDTISDFNESDPNQYRRITKMYIDQAIGLLDSPRPIDHRDLSRQLVQHCQRWDEVYRMNALEIYPQLADWFRDNGYGT